MVYVTCWKKKNTPSNALGMCRPDLRKNSVKNQQVQQGECFFCRHSAGNLRTWKVYVSTPMHSWGKLAYFIPNSWNVCQFFGGGFLHFTTHTQPGPCHYGRLRDDNLGWTQPAQYIELPGLCHFIEDKWSYVQVRTVLSHSYLQITWI